MPSQPAGPATIDPGLAPGGIVLRFYKADGQLLVEQCLAVPPDSLRLANQVSDQMARLDWHGPVAVIVYDGDTGEIWSAEDYQAFGYRIGGRIERPVLTFSAGESQRWPWRRRKAGRRR